MRTNTKFEQIIAMLAERWPKCFFLIYERHRVPLKIGIYDDIVAAGFPKAGPKPALRIYTSNRCYVWALRPGAPRIDLDGNAAGVVSEEHALRAKEELSRRKQKTALTTKPAPPKKLSLADLRAAAQARKLQSQAA
jgi:ProP effector